MNSVQQTMNLERFEELAYAGRYDEAAAYLMGLIEVVKKGWKFASNDDEGSEENIRARLQLNTRFAGAIGTVLAARQFQPAQEGYYLLMATKKALREVFMASGFGNLDYLHLQMLEKNAKGQSVVGSIPAWRKLLVTVTLGGGQGASVLHWVKNLSPDLAVPFWISFFDSAIVIDEESYNRRESLALAYEQVTVPPNYNVPDAVLLRAISAWMLVSYMGHRTKHQPKKLLNRIIRQYGEQHGVKSTSIDRSELMETKGKPTILVMLEHFTSSHAMYRCYKLHIESLRDYFNVVGLCIDGRVDDSSSSLFDKVYTFPSKEPVEKVAKQVTEISPDLIYYTSIGMQAWCVILSQFRFAPIQFMTLGHPATSMSPCMDYAISGRTDPELFSERVVYSAGYEKLQSVPHPKGKDFTYIDRCDGVVRIAINAKMYKINPKLIKVCQEVQAKSEQDLEFVFFPACTGITLDAFRMELSRHLEATVYPTTDYQTYIDRLRSCDMVLNPFPFGNTNGIYDCARIGLPYVCMDGLEPHTRVDAMLSEQLGYPEFLRASTPEEYTEAAIKLANSAELRSQIMSEVLARKEDGEQEASSDFGEMIYKLYIHHPTIQQGVERMINMDDYSLPERRNG